MSKLLSIFGIFCMFLSMSTCPFAIGADLELVTEVLSSHSIKIDFIEALEVLDSSPNEIVFATQNLGAYCGGGTPASAWKLILDLDTGDVISLEIKQSLSQIQNIRQSLFERSDGTLFTGGGWCGPKPPYYSTNGGDTWQPATHGVHPPNSTYSFVEFNDDVYAGTGYEPYHGQVYRWLGEGGANHWELVYDIAPPRSIVWTMSVYENQMFVGSQVYWWDHSGCENSVPVYISSDGNTFNATTGIPPCYSVQDVLVVGDHLVARAIKTPENYMYHWINNLQKWEEIAPYNLGPFWIRLVSHNGVIYAYGQAPSDTSKGIYQSDDLGLTWEQICVLENPDVSSMTIHDSVLYLGTRADANNTAYIYKLKLVPEFTDVPPGYWAENAIYKIYDAGITKGCSQDPLMFCPENTVTRDQMAVFLGRATHDSNFTPPDAAGIFADVPKWYWAADWIEQFYADGLTKGCKIDPHDVQSPVIYYCPEYPVTRTTMAIFLLRAKHGANYQPPPATGIFEDLWVNYWAADWIEQLYREGITTGCKKNPLMYCPEVHVRRDVMAVFLARMLGL